MTQTAAVGQADPGLSGRMKVLLALILTGQFMAVLDASIVNVAIPTIRLDLRAPVRTSSLSSRATSSPMPSC